MFAVAFFWSGRSPGGANVRSRYIAVCRMHQTASDNGKTTSSHGPSENDCTTFRPFPLICPGDDWYPSVSRNRVRATVMWTPNDSWHSAFCHHLHKMTLSNTFTFAHLVLYLVVVVVVVVTFL